MRIPLPSLATVTRSIAIMPELARETVTYAWWNYGVLLERLEPPEVSAFAAAVRAALDIEDDGDDEDSDVPEELLPLKPWQAGRLALEFMMLVRSHQEFPTGHHQAVAAAVPDVDSPQHAMDVIMALASMLNHVAGDEEIARFRQSLLEAEARFS